MATVYVQRDGGSNIIGVFHRVQPGFATEAIDDSDPEVLAFTNPPAPTNDEQVDLDMAADKTLHAMVIAIADELDVATSDLIDAIKIERAAL